MVGEWARVDLNYRPHAYQACALTRLSYGPRRRPAHDRFVRDGGSGAGGLHPMRAARRVQVSWAPGIPLLGSSSPAGCHSRSQSTVVTRRSRLHDRGAWARVELVKHRPLAGPLLDRARARRGARLMKHRPLAESLLYRACGREGRSVEPPTSRALRFPGRRGFHFRRCSWHGWRSGRRGG